MNLLSILTEKNPNKIQEKIQPVLESFYDEGINIEERIYYEEPFYYLNYSVIIEDIKNYPVSDFINIFKFCTSNSIYEYIRDYQLPNLIQDIISIDYSYLNPKERLEIYRDCLDRLQGKNLDGLLTGREDFTYKTKVLHQLSEYLNDNKLINLEGFILFRLRDYLLDLHDIIDRTVEDFLADREYNEFIKLLKYFVDVQESKLDIVNVIFDDKAKFKIYDEYNKLLSYDYITNVAIELAEGDINGDDMLISTLITIAPNEIIVHRLPTLKDAYITKTLESIFPEKVHYCSGCKWCSAQANANKE